MTDRIIDQRRRGCALRLLRSLLHPAAWWYACSVLLLAGCEGSIPGGSNSAASTTSQPPVIHAVRLIPNPPTLEGRLSLAVDAIDPERAPVAFRYQWYVNGAPLADAIK